MYIPPLNRMDDQDEILRVLEQESFGVLISQNGEDFHATHLPMLTAFEGDQLTLVGHMARANPQWRNLAGRPVLAVFSGPHTYISPTWYETLDVPTWNYVAVHVHGIYEPMEGEEFWQALRHMVAHYEPTSPLLAVMEETPYKGQMKAIVGFKIKVTKLEGKKKISQNRPPSTRARVVEALRQRSDENSHRIADWMEEMDRDLS